MPETRDDFWPLDIGEANITTPLSLMRAQAALLGEKTNQQVSASVIALSAPAGQFTWSFQLLSPVLGGYRYELFRASHPIKLYPVTVIWEEHQIRVVQTEEEFKGYLKQIIGSEQTKKIVQSLLSQIVR